MTRTLWKNIRRSITGSIGRYLAILCITMLGVGFLTGLRLTRPVMIRTAADYLEETQFYDLRLLSTVGFDDEDVAQVAALDHVTAAEGSYTADFVWLRDGAEYVLQANALSNRINRPALAAGRLPETAAECLLDADRFSEDVIGQQVTVDDWGTAEESPFAFDAYTVVGLARSPLHMSVERGTSSLGDGSLDGFVLVPPEGFDSEYYTQLYVKTEDGFVLYSDTYDDFVETLSEQAEDAVKGSVEVRFDDLKADAEKEIADGEAELQEKKAEGEAELADAKRELDDAKAQLEDGEKELADGKKELEDAKEQLDEGAKALQSGFTSWQSALDAGWAQYYDGDAQLKQALADGEKTLKESKKTLDAGEAEYKTGKASYDEGKAAYDAAEKELADAEKQATDGRKQLAAGQKELEDSEKALAAGRAEVQTGTAQLAAGETEYQEKLAEWTAGDEALKPLEAQYNAALEEWNTNLAAVNAGLEQVASALQALEAQKDALDPAVYESQHAALIAQQAELQTSYDALQAAKPQLDANGQALAAQRAALDAGKAELDQAAATLAENRAALEAAKAQLDAAEAQIAAGKKELAEKEKELTAAEAQIEAGKKELNKNKTELQKALDTLTKAREELDSGWAQYNAGMNALETQRAEQTAKFESARQALVEFQNGIDSYNEGVKTIEDSERELADGRAEYEDGLKEYEDGLKDFNREVSDAEAELADARQTLDELEDPEIYSFTRDANNGYMSFEGDSQIVENVAAVFPLFFFFIAALVCSTTMSRMVDDDRTQIGTMRALGYSRGSILTKYLLYSGSAAIFGGLIGYFGGGYLFPRVIWIAYGMLYAIPGFHTVWDVPLFFFAMLAAVLCSSGTAYLACRSTMRSTPADLIRPKMPAPGKRILLERITPLWSRLKFLRKVSLRNIFRFKKRMIMMLLGIAGCTALVLTGFGLHDSVANIGNYQFDDIQKYDISVTVTEPLTGEFRSSLLGAHGEETDADATVLMTSCDLTGRSGEKSAYIIASDDPNITEIIDLHHDGASVPYPGKGEILLSEKLAALTGVSKGDTVTLSVSDTEKAELTVSGVTENYVMNYAYMTGETYADAFDGEYEPKTLLLRVREGADEYALAAALSNANSVAAVSVVSDTRRMIDNMMQSLNYVVALVLASAAALAFVVLFNLGNINISERVREIATIKVLGFHSYETGAYVFRESLLLTLMGIAIGLPLGKLLHTFVMNQIQVDMVSFKYIVSPLSFLLTVAIVLLFSIVTDRVLRRKIAAISMTESLKSAE